MAEEPVPEVPAGEQAAEAEKVEKPEKVAVDPAAKADRIREIQERVRDRMSGRSKRLRVFGPRRG